MAYRASNVITTYIVLLVLSTFLTYGLAVGYGHVHPFVPYIGYIGDRPLESTIFTQFFVIDAVLLTFLVQIKYVCASFFLNATGVSSKIYANTASVYVGYLSSVGLFILACFQESHAYYVHHIGEFLYLFSSTLYFGLHTFISNDKNDYKAKMRLILNIFMIVFFIGFVATYLVAIKLFEKPWESRHHWEKNDGGWFPHILSAVLEWLLIILFQSYLFTFYADFHHIMITNTRMIVLPEEGKFFKVGNAAPCERKNKQNDLSGKYGQTRGINNGMEFGGNHLILLVSVLFPATMTVTFTLAVSSEHVYPVMPFMSYTGDLPVESCIFSMGLNLIAVLYIIISFLRYNQIIKFCEEENPPHVNTILRLNRNSLSWGLVSSLGLSVTASFQEVHAATVHRLGALVCTYSGFVYLWYQTIVSDLLIGKLNTKATFYLRLGLSIASTFIHIVAPVLVAILDLSYPKRHEETLLWSIEEEGWHLHVCCSFLEWSVFFINVIYVATYHEEFKQIQIKSDEIVFKRRRNQNEEDITEPSGHRHVKFL